MDLRVKHRCLDSLVISEHHHPHPVLCQVRAVVALRVEEGLGTPLLGTGGEEGGKRNKIKSDRVICVCGCMGRGRGRGGGGGVEEEGGEEK